MAKIDVALVGREQPADENLALRYLAAALVEERHRPLIVPLCGPDDLLSAVDTVLSREPALVGISIPDADIAVDALAFVRLLRSRGYRGYVTAGGALATLVRGEILAKHPGFDSIVRHDGEIALDASGRVVDVMRADGTPVSDTVRDCYLGALAGETFPCIGGEEIWQECVICVF